MKVCMNIYIEREREKEREREREREMHYINMSELISPASCLVHRQAREREREKLHCPPL